MSETEENEVEVVQFRCARDSGIVQPQEDTNQHDSLESQLIEPISGEVQEIAYTMQASEDSQEIEEPASIETQHNQLIPLNFSSQLIAPADELAAIETKSRLLIHSEIDDDSLKSNLLSPVDLNKKVKKNAHCRELTLSSQEKYLKSRLQKFQPDNLDSVICYAYSEDIKIGTKCDDLDKVTQRWRSPKTCKKMCIDVKKDPEKPVREKIEHKDFESLLIHQDITWSSESP